jgi:nicotinamidase-related amidase
MNPVRLADRYDSQLVLIDVQERLCSVMPEPALAGVLRNSSILLQAARLMDVPAIYTEQYPKGLGTTLPELAQWLEPASRVEKTCFSCCEESAFSDQLDDTRRQLVLTGMEAHICVLQTALQLHEMGRQVFVVEDAVLSRNPANHANAMSRLSHAGVIVTNTESVVFEWLKVAEGDVFKQMARLIR